MGAIEDIDRREECVARFSRRDLFRTATKSLLCLPLLSSLAEGGAGHHFGFHPPSKKPPGEKPPVEAMFYQVMGDHQVKCQLCFRGCLIPPNRRGYCGVRENQGGVLYSLIYGYMAAVAADPVEKKPLHHFLPGATAYSFGTAGCNLNCKFCHNWPLSQRSLEEVGSFWEYTPEMAVEETERRGAEILSFTYNEPTVFYEFLYEAAQIARKKEILTHVNTNAAFNEEPLRYLLEYTDSFTVDLKGFSDSFYQDVCQGQLEPVLRNLKIMGEEGSWVEIVNLVIPGLNDDPELIRHMCQWIYHHLGSSVPLYFNRFFPFYRLTHLEATPVRILEEARQIAMDEGLQYVYVGNVPGHPYNSTYCPQCQERVIYRHHFTVQELKIKGGACTFCGYSLAGVWEKEGE